jgi:predicted TIM-barrel fold metal-dependent hydrolase
LNGRRVSRSGNGRNRSRRQARLGRSPLHANVCIPKNRPARTTTRPEISLDRKLFPHSIGRYGCACGAGLAGLTRRGFLGALGVAGAAGTLAATGCATAPAAAAPLIDIHHHTMPPAWVGALKKYRMELPPIYNWTVQQSLDDMDKAGVGLAIASQQTPGTGFMPAAEAAAVARASNDYARQLAQDHPGRFGVFAMLPMPYVDETLKEIAHALDVLKADGVTLLTSYNGKYLGDPAFAPIMDELNRRKAVVYTHPSDPACCSRLVEATSVTAAVVEYGTDTTRTIASLIFSGTAGRCPDIAFIFSHAGGTLGALTDRFTVQAVSYPQVKARGFTGENVMRQLQAFHYDTAQSANPVAMAALTKFIPATQILFGTDYPYRKADEQARGLAAIFAPAELAMIERGNALRLLPGRRG